MAENQSWVSQNRGWLIAIGLIAAVYMLFRPTPSELPGGDLEAVLAEGEPVIVEFYTNT